MPHEAAEDVATAIFDAIHDNVATKADIAATRADIASVSAALKADIAAVSAAAKADLVQLKHDLTMRALAGMVTVAGLALAALHYWPPAPGG
jgi:hypothetical protein